MWIGLARMGLRGRGACPQARRDCGDDKDKKRRRNDGVISHVVSSRVFQHASPDERP